MKNKTRFILAATFSLVLITAVWAIPPATHATNDATQAAAQTQSASGTISAVDKDSFTITLPPAGNIAAANLAQQDPPKSMTFVVDKNTTIEGKLRVGANADVTYRDDNGNHVAIGVRVTPPQS
jgi:Cu/Ag efflux protein CusF